MAAYGPKNIVVSGEIEALKLIAAKFEAEGIPNRLLQVSHAFHSVLMDPVLNDIREVMSGITMAPTKIPLISDLDGKQFPIGTTVDREFWISPSPR